MDTSQWISREFHAEFQRVREVNIRCRMKRQSTLKFQPGFHVETSTWISRWHISICFSICSVSFYSILKYLDTLLKKIISVLTRTNVGRKIYRIINVEKPSQAVAVCKDLLRFGYVIFICLCSMSSYFGELLFNVLITCKISCSYFCLKAVFWFPVR